jgi:predicted aconitase
MELTYNEQRILEGKEGVLLKHAMTGLVKYGTALGAKRFIPITSAHTFFMSTKSTAQFFPPRRVQLTDSQVSDFCERLTACKMRARTTIDPGFLDIEKWRSMGGTKATLESVKKVIEVCRECGILANWTCIPYLVDNIPIRGEHCSWSESSALIYCNSIIGARTNRDAAEASFFSGLLGITPEWGMHLEENRKGTHLIDVQSDLDSTTDWGALGFFAGEVAGADIPVFINLKRPVVEEAKQLGAAINVPGGAAMFHIAGVTPEANDLESAFGGNLPGDVYVFDEKVKKDVYERINHKPGGKIDMVFIGCPHTTLEEIKNISIMLKGSRVAEGTKLWILTTHSIRTSAERLGYADIIEGSGGELLADGCLLTYYIYSDSKKPNLRHVATDSVKQALGVRRSFGSRVFLGSMVRCIQIAVDGKV